MSNPVTFQGTARLFDIASFSGGTTRYRVVLADDAGTLSSCTCPAFFYRTGHPDCKHLSYVRSLDEAGELEAPAGFTPGVATDVGDLAVLMESSLQSALTLGRKMGRMEAKR